MKELISRRAAVNAIFTALAGAALKTPVLAQSARLSFGQWVEQFRGRARARGISDTVYNQVMGAIKPDTSVYALDRAQPEFHEELWQYLNRRVSDWRIRTGRERAR